jgi:MYXO-CTERM domain-containing protein
MKSAKCLSKTRQQHSLLRWLVAGLGLFAAKNTSAAEYYVSPTGSDSGAGTQAAPFATVQKANDSAAAGDTIWMRAGTYNCTSQITLSKSGTSDTNRTKIWAYTGEVPILDFSNYSLASGSSDRPAITVTGSWMHLKGLEIANGKVGSSGSHSYSMLRTKNASNNTFELLNIHNGFGPGFFVDTGTGGNLVLNCDSHDNYDVNGSQGDGQNGDGFGVHYQTTGPSTIIRGCRSWHNSDDGYDFISQEVPVTIENSWAFKCGYGSSGNGNGFKIGSSKTGIRHLVQNNVAWSNAASGFYANHSTGGNTWYNNTSYNNGTQYNMLASSFDSAGNVTGTITLSGSKAHIMRNNIGFPDKNSNMGGVDTQFNTWDLNITPTTADFASTSDTPCTGSREADGSMPAACTMLHLAAGSKMIDKGTNVGLPYAGTAPDLGAYEYGATTTTGGTSGSSGGGTGAGGNTGAGGSTGNGGSTSSGGKTASGGTTGTGGKTASGGAPGTGGKTSSGGATGTGGALATGGVTLLGGAPGSGGALGTGGVAETGGTSGVVDTGGVGALAGMGTGGSVATGGEIATGGVPGSAGNTGPGETGGNPVTGGTPQPASTGGATGTGAPGGSTAVAKTGTGSGGCAVGSRSPRGGMAAFLMVGALALLVRRRRNRS